MLVEIIVCHEDMTGKRGENVVGMNILPFRNRDFNVLVGKPFITSILMMSLHYITNDVISLSQNYK